MQAEGSLGVRVEEELFTVEKALLAESSEYFRALFDSGMRECSQREIRVQGLTARGFRTLLRVLAGERPVLAGEEIVDAVECAAFLLAKPLAEHMAHTVNSSNCVLMFQAAAAYGLFDLTQASALFMRDLYPDLRRELRCLPEDELSYIESFPPSALVSVATHTPSEGFLGDVFRTFCYLDEGENAWKTLTALPDEATTALAGVTMMGNNIYIVGGVYAHDKRLVELSFCYHTAEDRWSQFPCPRQLRHSLTLTGQDGCLYAIGGTYHNVALASVERYRVATGAWTSAADLPRPAESVACAQAMGRIFVCLWLPAETTDVYEYREEADAWTLVTTLRRRQSYGHCMVAHADNLYVMRNGPADDFLRCAVDRFNLTRQQWSAMSGQYVNSKGALFTAVVRGDSVLTVNRMLTLVYDIQDDKWKPSKEKRGFPRSGSMHTFLLRLPKRGATAPPPQTLPWRQ